MKRSAMIYRPMGLDAHQPKKGFSLQHNHLQSELYKSGHVTAHAYNIKKWDAFAEWNPKFLVHIGMFFIAIITCLGMAI